VSPPELGCRMVATRAASPCWATTVILALLCDSATSLPSDDLYAVYAVKQQNKLLAANAKGCGLKCPGWWECSLAAISQTTTHMHGHHEATMGLAGVSLGRELRALALSHTASVRRGTA